MQSQVERICEMGQVMRKAMHADDQHYCSVRERLAQLEVSTRTVRATSEALDHIRLSKERKIKILIPSCCFCLVERSEMKRVYKPQPGHPLLHVLSSKSNLSQSATRTSKAPSLVHFYSGSNYLSSGKSCDAE